MQLFISLRYESINNFFDCGKVVFSWKNNKNLNYFCTLDCFKKPYFGKLAPPLPHKTFSVKILSQSHVFRPLRSQFEVNDNCYSSVDALNSNIPAACALVLAVSVMLDFDSSSRQLSHILLTVVNIIPSVFSFVITTLVTLRIFFSFLAPRWYLFLSNGLQHHFLSMISHYSFNAWTIFFFRFPSYSLKLWENSYRNSEIKRTGYTWL